MKHIPLVLAGLFATSVALAQPAPLTDSAPPPPLPNSARGERPMPPPPKHRGASFHLAHGADGGVRLDVECAERDATKDCADIVSQMLDKLNAVTRAK